MARRTKEDAAQTRIDILEAALNVFSENGYSRTTFVDIAAEIGLSKGAVYWHFKTKTDLLASMIIYAEEHLCEGRPELPDSVDQMRQHVKEYAERFVHDERAWKFEFFCSCQIEWSTELMEEVHEKLKTLREDPLQRLIEKLGHLQRIGVMKKEKNPEALAMCFGSVWVGAVHLAMYGDFDREKFIEVLMDGFDLVIGSQAA
ncbi:TetR/AcrR family transcriptional regulator [Pontiella agarivorans]|uniref:TetR family transcriptional regulator n=1 Tax=Pontiella agarivorans TaxID=3038953 RepID=A0ABU5MX63_9BACT|nr:TetR family transcriptional regulator [Pontiella agarivorans]MDZ8118810.1 TetR family transcriptional regulator [Pontiella agarivorans]